MPHRWSAGGPTTPSRPRAGRKPPSTWWRRWPATSCSTWAGGGCCSARRSARRRPSWPTSRRGRGDARHLPLRPRPARARGQGAPGAVRRPVVHLPVLAAPRPCPAEPAARRRRAGARHPRGRRRRQPHLRAVRHGPGARRRAVGQPAGPPHHLPRGRGPPTGADRHRDGHRPRPRASTTPRAASSLWTWPSTRRRTVPGVGEALVRALAERFHAGARTSTCR